VAQKKESTSSGCVNGNNDLIQFEKSMFQSVLSHTTDSSTRKLGKQCADYLGGITKQVFLVGSFLALFTVATLAAPANAYDKTPEAEALQKILQEEITLWAKDHEWQTSLAGAEWRTSLAGALQRYCESVLVQVPRNTPQEDRWLDQERRQRDSELKEPPNEQLASFDQRMANFEQRMATIMASPENARKTLIDFFPDVRR
jgi:hypothetical protein